MVCTVGCGWERRRNQVAKEWHGSVFLARDELKAKVRHRFQCMGARGALKAHSIADSRSGCTWVLLEPCSGIAQV
ncbi:hypothetical protein Nepgr_026325 [Nepenthes gracilis]|uniref:Uncharacterized protein n=1 Tax=Nepenthes gracilis TaxID=150966 RepID=A0AAD3T9J1_NEPGR|nr:hypothetical protein Nepgr_026325 [Nepenthes gracilis]